MLVVKHYRAWRKCGFSRWTCFKWSALYLWHSCYLRWRWWRTKRWAEKNPEEARKKLKQLIEFLKPPRRRG